MAIPKNPKKRKYMFSDDMKFLQKAVVYHPTQNKFLALRRSLSDPSRPNCWDLPGGNVLFGKIHSASLEKEIFEEASLKIKHIRPIQVITNYIKKVYYLFISYKCKAISQKVKLSREHSEYKWVTKREFLKLKSADFLVDLVKTLDK